MFDHPNPTMAFDSLPADLPHARPAVTIERFRPCVRGALIGYADVRVPSDGLTIHNIAIHHSGGDWISIRSR